MHFTKVEEKTETNLFIISPNNSGSTFLSKAISKCSRVASLEIEGQHMPCWKGPSVPAAGLNLIWAAPRFNFLPVLQNEANYDWQKIKECWYSNAKLNPEINLENNSNSFSVFLEKSPPHTARVKMLEKNFKNAKFIFLTRNPYAMAESIMRYRKNVKDILQIAGEHIVSCFELQKKNYLDYPQSLKITYEEMCSEHEETQRKIIEEFPELADLKLNQKLVVKQYNHELRNMNEEQISRLSNQQLESLKDYFSNHEDLFDYFGYEV